MLGKLEVWVDRGTTGGDHRELEGRSDSGATDGSAGMRLSRSMANAEMKPG